MSRTDAPLLLGPVQGRRQTKHRLKHKQISTYELSEGAIEGDEGSLYP